MVDTCGRDTAGDSLPIGCISWTYFANLYWVPNQPRCSPLWSLAQRSNAKLEWGLARCGRHGPCGKRC